MRVALLFLLSVQAYADSANSTLAAAQEIRQILASRVGAENLGMDAQGSAIQATLHLGDRDQLAKRVSPRRLGPPSFQLRDLKTQETRASDRE